MQAEQNMHSTASWVRAKETMKIGNKRMQLLITMKSNSTDYLQQCYNLQYACLVLFINIQMTAGNKVVLVTKING
jgi:hypothetical protein